MKSPNLPLLSARDYSLETRARLDVLTEELSSGRRTDIGRAVASDFSSISRVAHDIRTHDARSAALGRAGTWLDIAQSSLEAVGTAGERISSQLPAALTPTGFSNLPGLATIARGALTDMVSSLNTGLGGRPVFANGDPGAGSPVDLELLLGETSALAAGAVDLDDLLQAFDAYFAPPAGMGIEANAIRPFAADATVFPLGRGESIGVPISLSDRGIRDALKQAALVAALPDTGFALTDADRSRLMTELPTRGIGATDGVTWARARLGGVQERVAGLATELGEERLRLEGRQAEAVASDPFETATRLQSEMTRLETIFAVTARRARLRLTDFLR